MQFRINGHNICHRIYSVQYFNRPTPENTKFGTFTISAFSLPSLHTSHTSNRRDSSSGRASASCAVGQDGCRIDTWPRHTKDVIKMVPVATLLGAQHYKASTGFSSLTNHASLTSHN